MSEAIDIQKELSATRALAEMLLEKCCRIEKGLGVAKAQPSRKGKERFVKSGIDAVAKRNARLFNK